MLRFSLCVRVRVPVCRALGNCSKLSTVPRLAWLNAVENRLVKAQGAFKADLVKAQEASESRFVKAQEALKADLVKAQEASQSRLFEAHRASESRFQAFVDVNNWKVTTHVLSGAVAIVGGAVAVLHWLGFETVPQRKADRVKGQ